MRAVERTTKLFVRSLEQTGMNFKIAIEKSRSAYGQSNYVFIRHANSPRFWKVRISDHPVGMARALSGREHLHIPGGARPSSWAVWIGDIVREHSGQKRARRAEGGCVKVAYSFKTYFAPQIEDGSKRHTIRGNRRRHAHVGEKVQLFTGMRTRHCRKIMPDPVCIAVLPILLMSSDLIEPGLAYIEIDGRPLDRDEIEAFAISDGFSPERLRGLAPDRLIGKTARETMGRFWAAENPGTNFQGVIIRWEARG